MKNISTLRATKSSHPFRSPVPIRWTKSNSNWKKDNQLHNPKTNQHLQCKSISMEPFPNLKTNQHTMHPITTVMNSYSSILMVAVLVISSAQSTLAQTLVSPTEALNRLKEGNRRFVSGKTAKPRQDENRLKEVSEKQFPFATIIGCSDSRVPNEIIFDQGLGDLFIVRTAGQVSTYASWGSIEFAEEVLNTKLIVVLGHTRCGAVKAAVELPEVPGHIIALINAIKPAVEKARATHPDDLLDSSIRENIRMQVDQLKALEPVLAKRVREGSIQIVGALYDLTTGEVKFFE